MTALDRVLVVSGSIGKGHDTVAESCVQAMGVDAKIVDAVALLGRRGGSLGEAVFRQLVQRPALRGALVIQKRDRSAMAAATDPVAVRMAAVMKNSALSASEPNNL